MTQRRDSRDTSQHAARMAGYLQTGQCRWRSGLLAGSRQRRM